MIDINGFVLLFILGGMIFLGHIMGRVFNKIKMPEVTGFIVTGIILNLIITFAYGNKNFVNELVNSYQTIISIALSFVSFMIGTQVTKKSFKEEKSVILPVVLLQLIFVVTFTTLSFIIFKQSVQTSFLIGAISAATAPAAIIEITGKYKTKGRLTNTLNAIVSIDNIVGIAYFFIILSLVKVSPNISNFSSVLQALSGSLIEIVIGLLTGGVLVLFNKFYLKPTKDHDERQHSYLVIMIGILLMAGLGANLLSSKLSNTNYHFSEFIVTMVAGILFTNLIDEKSREEQNHVMHGFLPPLLTAFFVVAGMELDIKLLFGSVGLFALLYVATHVGGKFLGAYLGVRVAKEVDPLVKKNLPFAVLTQGGFEIFLAHVASQMLFDNNFIFNVVLTSVLLFEFFAPLLLTKALFDAGEVCVVSDVVLT